MTEIIKDGNTYGITLTPSPPLPRSEVVCRIGSDGAKFLPNVNISKWDDEFFVNLNASDFVVTDETETLSDNTLAVTIGGVKQEIWPVKDGKALDYKFTFPSRPATNTLTFSILCTAGLKWNYQDFLTQDEIDAGDQRPDNVNDSYAIYCPVSMFEGYGIGKFGHLYRWELRDADGQHAWAEGQRIEFDSVLTLQGHRQGTLTITLPGQWLDSARYPITLMGAGDWFGSQNEGQSGMTLVTYIVGIQATPAAGGTTSKIWGYLSDPEEGRNFQSALYVNGDTHLATSSEISNVVTAYSWKDMAIVQAITVQEYGICVWASVVGAGTPYVAFDSNGDCIYEEGETYNSWPDEHTWETIGRLISLYCEYTTVAGASIPIIMHHRRQLRR